MSIFSSRRNRTVNVLTVALITQNMNFILAFKYFAEFLWAFCLKHSLTDKVSFPLNSSNDALIIFPSKVN